MRFIMMIKSNAQAEAGTLPDEKLLTEMGNYNQKLIDAGAMLGGEGLHASAKGTRVRFANQKTSVIDGPFAEAKEMLAGFWLIQVGSRQEAIEWAKRVPGHEDQIEIRSLFEPSDFPADSSETADGWRDQEVRFRDAAAAAGQPARQPGTTRYMVMLRSEAKTESDGLPAPEVLAEMGGLMTEAAQSGLLLSGDGLKPSKHGARVRQSGDTRTVIDGPFAEAKELIAGYSIIQTKTKSEAIEFAKRWVEIHARGAQVAEAEIDVRPLMETSDFPVDAAEKPGGWRDQEQRFRDGSA
jgi:hypothetical protein